MEPCNVWISPHANRNRPTTDDRLKEIVCGETATRYRDTRTGATVHYEDGIAVITQVDENGMAVVKTAYPVPLDKFKAQSQYECIDEFDNESGDT